MDGDRALHAALVVLFVTLIPIVLWFRLRAHATREPLDRRREGWFILLTLRPIAGAMWIGIIAWLINPSSMAWAALPLPAWLCWTGVGVIVIAGALLVWTLRNLGKNLTDTVVTRKAHTLVMHGPYRWVRHPFYGAVALLVLGFSLAAANWFILLAGALSVALLVVRTAREEQELVARFGDDYRDYMRRTGRFFPRLGGGSKAGAGRPEQERRET